MNLSEISMEVLAGGTSQKVALSDGTDQYVIPNRLYRCQLRAGEVLAFIVPTGTGNAYVTFGA